MAINHTPLTAYLKVKNTNQEQAQMAGEVFKGIATKIGDKIDEYKTKKFFESIGDGDEQAIDAQIEEIDASLAELKEELAAAESELAALGGEN